LRKLQPNINKFTPYFAGSLRYNSGHYTILPHGGFLLDARRGNLPLLVCCQGLQHQQQDDYLSCIVME